MWVVHNMSKLVCTPTTCQPHPCVCDESQINAFTSTNQCRENVQLLPMHTNGHITPLKQTDNSVSLVRLPRASTLPVNWLYPTFLSVDGVHGINNTFVKRTNIHTHISHNSIQEKEGSARACTRTRNNHNPALLRTGLLNS